MLSETRAPAKPEHARHLRQIDLVDTNAVASLIGTFRPEVIINLAAVADIQLEESAMAVNTVGLQNLLDASDGLSEKPRIVHASTQLVVGPGRSSSGPRDYKPYTAYGESKAKSEEILWNAATNIEWVIIRPCLVWGPYCVPFAKASWKYLQKRWYAIPSAETAVRTYSYVGNLSAQFIAAAQLPAEQVNRKIFYGGDEDLDSTVWLDAFSVALTGKPTRRVPLLALRAMARVGDILAKLGAPSPFNSGRLFRLTQDYPNPIEESKQVLGPGSISMEEGVRRTVAWLRAAYPSDFT